MGTTRIKVIDLSGEKEQVKTSRKHAEKISSVVKIKEEKKAKSEEPPKEKTVEPGQAQEAEPITQAPPTESAKTPSAKITKTRPNLRHLGLKYLKAKKLIEAGKNYPLPEAIELLNRTSITHFDPTVEVHLNVNDKNVRGQVQFPYPVDNKSEKIYLIFSDLPAGRQDKRLTINDEPIIWGNEKTIEDIENGKLKPFRDFDVVIATRDFMPKLAKVAKILGPKGLMPNPKNATVIESTQDVLKKDSQKGLEYKTDPTAPIIHTKIGKLSNKPNQLEENLKALIFAIGPAKIKKATLTSTMGPGIKLDLTSVTS